MGWGCWGLVYQKKCRGLVAFKFGFSLHVFVSWFGVLHRSFSLIIIVFAFSLVLLDTASFHPVLTGETRLVLGSNLRNGPAEPN